MAWFLYWQKVGGEDAWQCGLAETRQQLISKEQPRFVTVLDVSAAVDESFTKEQIDQLRYQGSLYFDFDGQDIGEVLDKVRTLLGKLVEQDVDPRSVEIYATGGRGFHIEVPQEIFIAKPPKQGTQRLPAIYKEMAYELYVDTLDLRVYSARKGRMWRTPNVRRENGKFKVPITPDELMNMTAADYELICSTPRIIPAPAPPTLSQKLAVLYARAASKVDAASKRRKDSKKDFELLAKFGGAFPPSLLKVMSGEIAGNAGFHKIALQVAISSNALGKTEAQMLAACEGLVANHVSDGARYNSPDKRRAELARLYTYTQGNPCYEYSRDAVRSLVPVGTLTPDLDGLTDEVTGAVTAEGTQGDDDGGFLGGVFITENGIFLRTEDGARKISTISFRDVCLLYEVVNGNAIGFETELLLNGQSRGRQLVKSEDFQSKQRFVQFCGRYMGAFNGVDNHLAAILEILRSTAMKNNNIVYITNREGLDLIRRPEKDASGERPLDFVWVSKHGVHTEAPVTYKLRGVTNEEGMFKSDLLDAPDFKATEETAEVLDALFSFNEPYVVANLLGWMVACFHRQVYHHAFKQFPLLQVFGQSGAGKSTTIKMLLRMHYYKQEMELPHADAVTPYAASSMIQSSASIPVIFDEFKPRQMKEKVDRYRQMFRAAYNASTLAKGGMNSSWKDVSVYGFSAPVGFIGEGLEAETAILERSVAVCLSKGGLMGRRGRERVLHANAATVSSLGREVLKATFGLDFDKFVEMVQENTVEAGKLAFKKDNDRGVFNLAVVTTGLKFLAQVVRQFFGGRFQPKFDELLAAAMDISKHVSVSVMPEAAKVLNILAHISRTEDALSEFGLRHGVDYVLISEDVLDLHMRQCYYKYAAWSRRKGQAPLYDNEDAFVYGLSSYGPLIDRAALNPISPLKNTGMEKIFRFSIPMLREEGVEPFKA